MKSPLNIFFVILLFLLILLNFLVRNEPATRNMEFLPDMVTSVAYDAQDENPNFPDGQTLRQPVEGTIPRGYTPLRFAGTQEDALRAGSELHNPYTIGDRKHVERGRIVFMTFCAPCHGAAGLGDGLIPKYGFPPPPSLLADRALKLPDGQIFHIASRGQGNMPSYASQLSQEDRWNAVLFIRSLQGSAALPEAVAP